MSDVTESLSIGIIGLGFLGSIFAEQIDGHSDARIGAITEIDSDRRAEVGEEFAIPTEQQYGSYERMLDVASLNAVAISTPHALHYEQIVASLDRGLHVLCEKPLVTELADARALADRMDTEDRVLMVGYQRHLDPAFIRARERWQGDRTPNFVTAEITQDLVGGYPDSWYLDPDLSGGGQLYATGTHLVDAVLWTTGLTPRAVTASMDFIDQAERVDQHAMITVEFEEGAVGTFSISGATPRVREHLHLWDDDGAAYIDGREWGDRTLTLIDADGTERSPYVTEDPISKIDAFVDAIRSGEAPPATVRDALRATAVKEAAYEAARRGTRVTVDL